MIRITNGERSDTVPEEISAEEAQDGVWIERMAE